MFCIRLGIVSTLLQRPNIELINVTIFSSPTPSSFRLCCDAFDEKKRESQRARELKENERLLALEYNKKEENILRLNFASRRHERLAFRSGLQTLLLVTRISPPSKKQNAKKKMQIFRMSSSLDVAL